MMDDDLNSAGGLGLLFDKIRSINRLLDSSAAKKDIKSQLLKERRDFLDCAMAMGLFQEEPTTFLKEIAESPSEISTEEIETMIQERNQARKRKDWAKADSIRSELSTQGIILEDGPQGTNWRLRIARSE